MQELLIAYKKYLTSYKRMHITGWQQSGKCSIYVLNEKDSQ